MSNLSQGVLDYIEYYGRVSTDSLVRVFGNKARKAIKSLSASGRIAQTSDREWYAVTKDASGGRQAARDADFVHGWSRWPR